MNCEMEATMTAIQNLTLSEASYVLDRSPTAINKAVDTGIIRARQRRVGNAVLRLLGPAELRFLRLADELDKDLTPTGRRRLYEAIRKLPGDSHRVTLGQLVLDLAGIDSDLKVRLRRLDAIRNWVEPASGNSDAAIKGTNIPVYMIAALARTETAADILADYPSLSAEKVEAAIEYAKAYPKRGRPYPVRSLKRALADLAAIGAFDESDDRGEVPPRKIL
jgi:uncharacterized protein (DUF433 family)